MLSAEQAGFAFILAALTMAAIPLLSRLGRALFPARAAPPDPALLPPADGQ